MQRKHPISPLTKKFKIVPPASKVMLTGFWDCLSILTSLLETLVSPTISSLNI